MDERYVLICDSSPSPLCHTVVVMEKASISKQVTKSTKGNARKRREGGNGDHARPTPGCGVSVSVHPPMPLRSRTRGQPGAASSAAPTAAVYSQNLSTSGRNETPSDAARRCCGMEPWGGSN